MQQTPTMTHDLWLEKYVAGQFRGWRHVGEGYIEKRGDGTFAVHNYQDLTSIGGWGGYTQLLPKGMKPKDPEPKRPSRPQDNSEDH